MPQTYLLYIGESTSALNKRQREFNQLSKKIEHLDQLIPELQTAYEQMLSRIPTDLNPLVREYQTYRAEIVHLMDRTYSADLFRKAYQTKLAYLVKESAFDLIANHGFDELKSVFNKYSEVDIDTLLAKEKNAAKVTDPAYLLEEEAGKDIYQGKPFHELPDEDQQRIRDEQRNERVKQQIAEGKERKDMQKITKSVRNVYTDLVKAFHPDLEKDETEKLRKTEIMQRVTQAYQENNMLQLLKLQIEFERIDQDHLENLSKNQLNYYNKVLRQQVEDLELEKEKIQKEISAICGLPYQHANSLTTVIVKFNTNVNEMKAEIKNIKNLLKHWKIPSQLKAYLKTYQIPNQPHEDEGYES
jgi:triphosphoribosyl-dephospho-CoA synthetase